MKIDLTKYELIFLEQSLVADIKQYREANPDTETPALEDLLHKVRTALYTQPIPKEVQ